jgi:hypothetical protein
VGGGGGRESPRGALPVRRRAAPAGGFFPQTEDRLGVSFRRKVRRNAGLHPRGARCGSRALVVAAKLLCSVAAVLPLAASRGAAEAAVKSFEEAAGVL